MLRELPFWSLLEDRPDDAEVILANFEDSKFVFLSPADRSLAVVSDREEEHQLFRYSTQDKEFVRVSSDATTLVFEVPTKTSLLESVGRLLWRDGKAKLTRFDLLNVARLTWTSIFVGQRVWDVAERTPGVFLIVTEDSELWEYDSALHSVREIARLEFRPLKLLTLGTDILLIAPQQIHKYAGNPETLRGKIVLRNPIESCFLAGQLLVCLSAEGDQFFLETVDLSSMCTHKSVKLPSAKNQTVDLYMGTLPFIDRDSGKSETAVLVTFSSLASQEAAAHSTHFLFHRLSNLQQLAALPTNYVVENRNLFLAGAWGGDAPGMRGVIANYGDTPENLDEIHRLEAKIESQQQKAAEFLTFSEAQLTSANLKIWAQHLRVPLQAGAEHRFSSAPSRSVQIQNEVLPILETALEGPHADRLRSLMFFRKDGKLVFEDEGDFFHFGLAGLTAKFFRDFEHSDSVSSLRTLKHKTDSLRQLAVAYLKNRRLYAFASGDYAKTGILEAKLAEALSEIDRIIDRLQQLRSLIEMRTFVRGMGGVHPGLVDGERDSSLGCSPPDLEEIFRAAAHQHREGSSDSVKRALTTLFGALVGKRRAVETLDHVPPRTMLEILLSGKRSPSDFGSLESLAAFIADPLVDYNTKAIALGYCLINSGRQKLVERFLSDCDIPSALFGQAKALLGLDKAAVAKAVQAGQASPISSDDHRDFLHQFLIFFDASICSEEVCKQVLVNLTVMEAPWAVAALFASTLDWKAKVGTEFCVRVLVLNNLQTHIGGLVGEGQREASEERLAWLASEIIRGGFQPTTAFINNCLKKSASRTTSEQTDKSPAERQVRELMRQERLDQALDLINQSALDTKEFSPSTRFLLKLVQENKRDWLQRDQHSSSFRGVPGPEGWLGEGHKGRVQ